MSTNQELRQASVRASTGTTRDYNGDWSALFDAVPIAQGPFNQRLLAWINGQLGVTYTNLENAMTAYAVSKGAPNWPSLGSFSLATYSPEATALFAAMAVQPNAARKTLINTLITTLISAGVWAKLDVLWVLAAHDAQAGRLNWLSPSTLALTENGTITFAVDQGYLGNGVNGYLASTYAPGFGTAAASQNSVHLGSWSLTDRTAIEIDIGSLQYTINPRSTSATAVGLRNSNATSDAPTVSSGTSRGHTLISRGNASNYQIYINGVSEGSVARTSQAPANWGYSVCCRNDTGVPAVFSNRRIAVGHGGVVLTATDATNLYNALLTFLVALGN